MCRNDKLAVEAREEIKEVLALNWNRMKIWFLPSLQISSCCSYCWILSKPNCTWALNEDAYVPGPNAKNRINCSFKRTFVQCNLQPAFVLSFLCSTDSASPGQSWYLSDSLGTMHRFNLGFIQRYGTKNQDRTRIFVSAPLIIVRDHWRDGRSLVGWNIVS